MWVPFRTVAKLILWALAFAYAPVLVILGVVFGGLVFWAGLGGSIGVIWVIFKKTGYVRNFEGWNIGYRKFLALFAAFGVMLGIVYGLIYTPVKASTIPLLGGILLLVFVVVVWKASSR